VQNQKVTREGLMMISGSSLHRSNRKQAESASLKPPGCWNYSIANHNEHWEFLHRKREENSLLIIRILVNLSSCFY
jgi:hypothetical protein